MTFTRIPIVPLEGCYAEAITHENRIVKPNIVTE
ncbi:hypothetical protein AsAng_0064590 (plasmid) [Aureispira anguillae]|uniref:Uncharacterized protein n=1 Tax=Aureispira anguillae TaxID=2864201 RepID=A0A915YM66_9BACT|nr:hypothetical protein AsAng_0064590 [Aureispira anguillae]